MTPRDLIEKFWTAVWELWTAVWKEWSAMVRALNRFLDTPFSYMIGVIGVMVSLAALVLVPYGIMQWLGFVLWKRQVRKARAQEEAKGWTLNYIPLTWAEYRRARREERESE